MEGDVTSAHTNDFLKRYHKAYYDKSFDSKDTGLLSYSGSLDTKEFRKTARSILDSDEYKGMKL